jgi:hypothetical protein
MLSPAKPGFGGSAVMMISDRDIDDPELRATITAAVESSPGHFGSFARPRRMQDTLRRARSKMIAVTPPASMDGLASIKAGHIADNDATELNGPVIATIDQAVEALRPKLLQIKIVKARNNLINNWLKNEGLLALTDSGKPVFISDRSFRRYFKNRPLHPQ